MHWLPNRCAIADIDIAGTVIPAGAPITLVIAAGNRDPNHVSDPDRFDPDRRDLEHLGFGTASTTVSAPHSPGRKLRSH